MQATQSRSKPEFLQVIFPVVLWLHSYVSFFHYVTATVGHLLPGYSVYVTQIMGASSRHLVSWGAAQKTAREKIKRAFFRFSSLR